MVKAKYLFAFVLMIALAAVGCNASAASDEAYLTIEINPSIEVVVNRRDKVVYASALNDDGEVLLAEADFEGRDIKVAVEFIIERAVELGYIDPGAEEITVSVAVLGRDKPKQEKLREKVCARFNQSFASRGMYGHARGKEFPAEIVTVAEELGISPERLMVVKQAMIFNPELTLEECLEMTVEDLIKTIRNLGQEIKDIVSEKKKEFFAARDELFAEYEPFLEALRAEIADLRAQIAIAADEEEKAALRATLKPLEEELAGLREELRSKVEELKEEYREISREAKERVRDEFHTRREEFKERLKKFREEKQNKDEIKKAVEEWQRRRGK